MERLRAIWSGFPGGDGVSTFYFADAAAAQSAVRDFFVAIHSQLPQDVTVTVDGGGDVIDPSNGALTGIWVGTVQTPVAGNSEAVGYAAPVGILARWETTTVVSGSRLRGRTFIVPTVSAMFEADGTPKAGDIATLVAAATALVGATGSNMLVWQRPRAATAAYTDGRGKTHKALSSRSGSTGIVVTASVPNKAVVLRSRRD